MTRNTFLEIVRIVQLVMEKRDTQLCRGSYLWQLSTGNLFRTTAKTFAVGKSTAVPITHDFCSEIQRLLSGFIKFPNTKRETAEAIEKFRILCPCQIPQALGALDGTHISILAPSVDRKADYYSRKQCYTILLVQILYF